MKYQLILFISLFILILYSDLNSWAQITTDGSVGRLEVLSGPNYSIDANLGQQLGGNLFHSFQEFNLQQHESAHFSGPDTVQNIITRVTGGHPSHLDGLMRSTIPQAQLYFLNPYGIIFGPNVQLDVQGGFHVTTANYLQLEDGGYFGTRHPNDHLLTLAPVHAFGFLNSPISTVSIQGRGELSKTEGEGKLTGLAVPQGQILSIIAGDINMTGSYYQNDQYIQEYRNYIRPLGNLTAPSGRINLASVASMGKVIPTATDLDVSTFEKLGNITLLDKSLIEISGPTAGTILIRAAELSLQNTSQIFGNTLNYQVIESKTSNELNPRIDLNLQKLSMGNSSRIAGYAFAPANLSDILIQADDINLKNGSWINSQSYTSGRTGEVSIKTDRILIEDGGIGVIARDTGQAGHIHIKATQDITVTGADSVAGWSSGILSLTTPTNKGILSGLGGDIKLETNNLTLKNGAQISSSSIAGNEKRSQAAGNILIQATGAIELSGVNPYGENENGLGSGIYVRSTGNDAGNAGTISISANTLSITEGAQISGGTSGRGQGGYIRLDIRNHVFISGNSAHRLFKEPKDSQLQFRREFPNHPSNRIEISGIYGNSFSQHDLAGEAGTIYITTPQLILTGGGAINTATQKASGGHIVLNIPQLLHLQESNVTTSVDGGDGNGGNITVHYPRFVILNQGQIKAQSNGGQGGNIRITAENFFPTVDSLISASSKLGIDGQIEIEFPDRDVSTGILGLNIQLEQAKMQLSSTCKTGNWEDWENRSHFHVYHLTGNGLSPYGWMASPTFQLAQKLSNPPHFLPLISQPGTRVTSHSSWLKSCD